MLKSLSELKNTPLEYRKNQKFRKFVKFLTFKISENRSENCTENGLPVEYSFSNNWTTKTASIHFNLLCDREKLVHDFKTGTMMGLFPGVLLSGLISDKFGRRTAMIIFSFLSSLAALFTRLVGPTNVGYFIIGRIFMNGCAHGARKAFKQVIFFTVFL